MSKKPKVVIVEDDPHFRLILAKRMESIDCEVQVAENGEQGLETIRSFHPDLVISDLMMPQMTGQELCQKVKADPELKDVYFMMLTARDSVSDRVTNLEGGADDHLAKPASTQELLARVRAGLRVRQLYNQIRASEKKYQSLVENASDAIVLFDIEGHCVDANERASQLLGYDKDKLKKMRFVDLLADDLRDNAVEKFQSMFQVEHHFIEEISLERCDGQVVPVESANTIIKADTEVIRQSIFRDLTERRERERQIFQIEKLKALGGMVGGVAHDFNNILAAILGYTELALRDTKDERMLRRLRVIERAARDGAETVRLLQEFAKGQSDTKQDIIDLNKLINQVILVTRHYWKDGAQAKGVSIEIEKQEIDPVPLIQGSQNELREALANIVFNAVDAIMNEGKIYFQVKVLDQDVYITIRDTGIGMSEDVQARIFDPFFTTKGVTSSGLGLSVGYGVINRHNGEIKVESALTEGTTFTIRLPLYRLQSPADTLEGTETLGNGNVLIIDDEDVVRGAMTEILESFGYIVTGASSGEQGIRAFAEGSFDLVMTDLGMPGLNGWEVAEKIKTITPQMPIILLTGWANQRDIVEENSDRVDLILPKPIHAQELLAKVEQLCQRRETS
jgi:PAS domain S-box-containing protein